MKRLLRLLFPLCLLLACAGMQHFTAPSGEQGAAAPHELRSLDDSRKEHAAAQLRDARGVLHVFGSRSQRVQPTTSQGSNPHRTAARVQTFLRHRSFDHQHRFGKKVRRETSPFCFAASRHYYVIALRRLLC